MQFHKKQGAFIGTLIAASCICDAQAGDIGFYALLDGGFAQTSISGGGTAINGKNELMTGGYAPNFFGIKGERDMGDGYTAGFTLEQGFLLGTPNNPNGAAGPFAANSQFSFGDKDGLFNRQANVSLVGSGGTLRFGTQPNMAFGTVVAHDPRSGSNYGSGLPAVVTAGGLTTADFGSISYTSPTANGLTGSVQYKPQNSDAYSGIRGVVNYAGDGLSASLAAYANSSNTNGDSNGYVAGLTKSLGDFNLKLLAASQNTQTYAGLLTLGAGGSYKLTSSTTLDAGIYSSKKNSYSVNTAAVGMQYKFLKDLTFYTQYASVSNNGTDTAVFNFTPPNDTNFQGTIGAGQTANSINLGFILAFF